MYCSGCEKEHEDSSWQYSLEFEGWFCSKYHTPTSYEFIPEQVKEDRVEYFNSIVQPFRGGELSKEYVEAHGTEGINVTEEEVKNAKEVWKGLSGWRTRRKSK